MAETTTTGRKGTASVTIAATLRKAFASSTDVPPNFMMVGFIRIFGVRRLDAAFCEKRFNQHVGRDKSRPTKALISQRTPKTKRANRKAYDWPLNLEKLLRHKTSGALVVALHQWCQKPARKQGLLSQPSL